MNINYYIAEICIGEKGEIDSLVKDRWSNHSFTYTPIDIPCKNRFHIEYEAHRFNFIGIIEIDEGIQLLPNRLYKAVVAIPELGFDLKMQTYNLAIFPYVIGKLTLLESI